MRNSGGLDHGLSQLQPPKMESYLLAGRGGAPPFLLGCFWGWGGGVGCQRSCYADDVTLIIWGWGGVGWDVNVHVTLMMLR